MSWFSDTFDSVFDTVLDTVGDAVADASIAVIETAVESRKNGSISIGGELLAEFWGVDMEDAVTASMEQGMSEEEAIMKQLRETYPNASDEDLYELMNLLGRMESA